MVALSILTGRKYPKVHALLKELGRVDGGGTYIEQWLGAVPFLGKTLRTRVHNPRKDNGGRYTLKSIGKGYPKGKYLVRVRGHVLAMINGEIHDWTNNRQFRVIGIFRVV